MRDHEAEHPDEERREDGQGQRVGVARPHDRHGHHQRHGGAEQEQRVPREASRLGARQVTHRGDGVGSAQRPLGDLDGSHAGTPISDAADSPTRRR